MAVLVKRKDMNVRNILNADYRTKEGQRAVDRALRLIGPLKKKEKDRAITIEEVEDVIGVMCCKYQIAISEIRLSCTPELEMGHLYSARIWDTNDYSYVYGCCIYEVMAKAAIKIYLEIKKGNIEKVK